MSHQSKPTGNTDIHEEITEFLKKDKVVLFMKGVPSAPQCGFSNTVCQILKVEGVEDFGGVARRTPHPNPPPRRHRAYVPP